MVNPLLQNRSTWCQNYVTDTKENLFISSITFTQLKSAFPQLHVLKFLCRFDHFPRRNRRKQKWVFFYWNTLYISFRLDHRLAAITSANLKHFKISFTAAKTVIWYRYSTAASAKQNKKIKKNEWDKKLTPENVLNTVIHEPPSFFKFYYYTKFVQRTNSSKARVRGAELR